MVRLQLSNILQNQSEPQSPMLKTLRTQTLSTRDSKWVGNLFTTRRVWSRKIIQVYRLISQTYYLLLFCVGTRWGELVTQFPTVYSLLHVGTRLQLLPIFCRKQRGKMFYFLLFAGSRGVEVSVQIFVENIIKVPCFLLCTLLLWETEGMGFLLSTLCRKYTIVLVKDWRGEPSTHLSVWMIMGELSIL